MAYDLGILLKNPKFSPGADWALFCPVLCFGLIPNLELHLGVILLLGFFTNILKFTIMTKYFLNKVLLEEQLASKYS